MHLIERDTTLKKKSQRIDTISRDDGNLVTFSHKNHSLNIGDSVVLSRACVEKRISYI